MILRVGNPRLENYYEFNQNTKMNKVGENPCKSFRRDYTLSLSWYKRPNKDKKTKLKRNLNNFYQNITHSNPSNFVWTTLSDYLEQIKTDYVFESSFISLNTRATNEKKECKSAAYLVDRFLDPSILHFLNRKISKLIKKTGL